MSVIRPLAVVAAIGCLSFAWYSVGFQNGRRDTIHQLFSGEKDFKQYLSYRKTGGEYAELLQKLINCLRNDFGLVAEWDGLRRFWTIEVDHEG